MRRIELYHYTLWGEKIKKPNENDNYIGIDEAAEYLVIKTVTLRKWLRKENNIPVYKIGKLCNSKKLN